MMAKILLVEDNPVTRKGAAAALFEAGYRVVEATNAAEAQSLLALGPLDMILLDTSLPDADPEELLERLHKTFVAQDVPVLALTEEADDARLLSAGFTDTLTKPVEVTRLLCSVRIHLARTTIDPPGDGSSLLLVDANPRTLRLASRRFQQLGFEIFSAANATEALRLLGELEPTVVIADLLAENLDGFELCQAIHALPAHAARPVILVSAQQLNPIEREFAARIGAAAVVSRTGDLNALVDAVLDALSPRSRRSGFGEGGPVSQDYRKHAITTLEQRANLREDLARRDGTLRAVRTVLECLNDLGGRSRDEVLYGALAAVLDATGFSMGAAYLVTHDGSLELRRQLGFPEDRLPEVGAFWGHLPLLLGVMEMGEPRGASAGHAIGTIQQVLASAQIGSMILMPLKHGQRSLGVLALGARTARLMPDWLLLSETVVGSIANVVALAETATQLVETERRFHGIAESTVEGIVVCDAERQVTYANAALLRILDLPSSEVLGRVVDDLLPFVGGSGEGGHGTLTRGDGVTIPAEATARTVEDPTGRACRLYVVRDLSERVRLSQVAWLASHDALTGLHNRHRFEEDLAQRVSESRRYGSTCAVLLIDIDHFKLINDTYGHQAGDSVLCALADVLRTCTRESDVPARLGGDEFIVLLPHASLDQARACASKLFEKVQNLCPTYQGWSLPVSISIGVAACPQHGAVAEALVTSADDALYRAKRAGRGQICVQDSSRPGSITRMAAAARLEREPPPLALESEEPAPESLAQNG